MLTSDDLKKIEGVVQTSIQPLDKRLSSVEKKIDNMTADIKDLKLETKGIHIILEQQEKDFGLRLERLEDSAGIN